jgi:hypothetical protein
MLKSKSPISGLFLLAIVGAALVGCASAEGPNFQAMSAPADRGVAYFYKAPNQIAAARGLTIMVDGAVSGVLQNQGYVPLTLTAGHHVVTVRVGEENSSFGFVPNFTPLELDVRAGESIYVRVNWSASGGSVTSTGVGAETSTRTTLSQDFVSFTVVPEATALPEISATRLSQ